MNLFVQPNGIPDYGVLLQLPHSYMKDLIEWASLEYRKHNSCSIAHQSYSNQYLGIEYYIIETNKPVRMNLYNPSPSIILQITIDGDSLLSQTDFPTEIIHKKQTVSFYYLPKNTTCVNISSKKFHCILFEFKRALLTELSEDHPVFKESLEYMNQERAEIKDIFTGPCQFVMMESVHKMMKINQVDTLDLALKSTLINFAYLFVQQMKDNEYYQAKVPFVLHKDEMMQIRNAIMVKPHLQECKINNLARRFYLSRQIVSHSFYQLFGIHISDFILHQIMDRALLLIISSDLTISEIAEELGYSNRSNFTRAFNEVYKESPIQVRTNRGLSVNSFSDK